MARKQNLQIDQGAEFEMKFDLHDELGDPLDVTDFTARAVMKQWYDYGNTYSFATTLTTGLLTLTLDNANTTAIPAGRYVYNAEIISTLDGSVMRVVEGNVDVSPDI